MLIWDWSNFIGEAELYDCSFFLLLEKRKERRFSLMSWFWRRVLLSPPLPVLPLTLKHWLCMFDPVFSSCACPVVYPQIYKEQLNTRVVLVAVETWTEKDHIDITTNPVQMLHEFSKYRQRIRQHADAVHLISYVSPALGLTLIFIPLLYQLGYISINQSWTSLRLIPLLHKKHRSRLPSAGMVVPQSWDLLSEYICTFRPSILRVNSWFKTAADTPAFTTGSRHAREGGLRKGPPSSWVSSFKADFLKACTHHFHQQIIC